jgi:hypothetical protein
LQLRSVHLPTQDRYLVAEYEQFDVLGAAVTGEVGCRICRSSWYASEALMAGSSRVKRQRQADNVACQRLEPGLRADTLDPCRPVRDISLISDEIITPLFAANDVQIKITLDIESAGLDKLPFEANPAARRRRAVPGSARRTTTSTAVG